MKPLNKETANKPVRPERIIQFGEGNFLRAFVDWTSLFVLKESFNLVKVTSCVHL